MFHDFAGRTSGACSAITGIVHIGIAIGIIISLYKLFLIMSKEFALTFKDIFKKQLKGSAASPSRSFMYMSLLSFVPMLLWLIPCGKAGLLFNALSSTSHNGTLLDDGIMLIVTAVLVFLSARALTLSRNDKNINVVTALIVGFVCVLLLPVSGLSFTAGVFAVLMLMGVSKKLSFRYTFLLSVPVLIVKGIVELCISVTSANAVMIIVGIVVSAAVAFIFVKLFRWMLDAIDLKYFALYDASVGVIIAVIGIFELILK